MRRTSEVIHVRDGRTNVRRWLQGLGLGLVAALITALIQSAMTVQPIQITGPPPEAQPGIEQGPLKQTTLEEAKSVLGPFTVIPVQADSAAPDTHAPAVLLLDQDGSTQASTRWTVPFSATTWSQRQSVFGIDSLRANADNVGYVTFGSNGRLVFTVKVGQPFILESQPGTVVLIGPHYQLWTISTERAEILRNHL